MFKQRVIGFLLGMISLTSFAQGRLWNRGTIQLDAGTEARVHGNILLDAPVTGDGYLTFAGSSSAQASGQQLQTDYFRMESTAPLKLHSNFTITQQADFISGVLDLQGNDLIFGEPEPVIGGNASSYIQTTGAGRVRFPVNSDTASLPLGIQSYYIHAEFSQAGTADTFSVQLWPALTDNGTVTGNALNSHVGSWALEIAEAVAGQNDISLSLQWSDASLAVDFFEPQSTIIHYNGTTYVPLSLCGTDLSGIDPNALQISGFTDVGVFGVGDSLYLPPQPQAVITAVGATSFCQGDSVLLQASTAVNYSWSNGLSSQEIYVSASGSYQVTVTDANGCQSVSLPVDVTVYQPHQVTVQQTACDEFVWAVTGQTYTSSGNYPATLQNQNGCDSVITLQLIIESSVTYNQNFSICPGSSVTVGNNTYNAAGTYIDVLAAQNGCDSTVITVVSMLDCSGLSDETQTMIQIYPNPATGWIVVVSTELSGDFLLEIFTLQGQQLLQELIQIQPNVEAWVDVSSLASGSYILRIGNKVLPFIKQ